MLVIGVFMLMPMFIAVAYSFLTANPYGGVLPPPTFDAYVQFLFQRDFDDSLVFSPSYIFIILRSVYLAVATTGICLVLGLPVAWYIVCQTRGAPARPAVRRHAALLDQHADPHLLLDPDPARRRPRQQSAAPLGVIAQPLPLLYNDGSILLGLVYTFLPFMVLPIYSTLERIDPRLIEAAYDLYANAHGRLPPRGLAAGEARRAGGRDARSSRPALGSFLAPDLLGGGKKLLIGSLIQMQFTSSRNWPFGAALSTVVTVAILLVLVWRTRQTHRRDRGGSSGHEYQARTSTGGTRPACPAFTALIIVFLYAPLLILVIYAFNASRLMTVWSGFSLHWFVQVAHNGDIRDAALNSLIIAVAATIASTAIATAGALALERGGLRFGRGLVTGMIAMPLVVPEIVVAITTLIFFSALGMHYGLLNLIIAHTVFCIPFAVLPDPGAARATWAARWRRPGAISMPTNGSSSAASRCRC